MPRLKKIFKKYERMILLGLVILLLASFSITGAIRCARTGGGPKTRGMGGSFKISPSDTEEISDEDFDKLVMQQDVFRTAMPFASHEFLQQTFGMEQPTDVPAAWIHQVLLQAAVHAGYEAGERQVTAAIQDMVGAILSIRGGIPYSDVAYKQYLRNTRTSPATFRKRMREMVLKDEFLYPLVMSSRYEISYPHAYETWKPQRERVDLQYVSLPAAHFAQVVRKEEESRRTISKVEDRVGHVTSVAGTLARVLERVQAYHEAHKSWPKDLPALEATGVGITADAWGQDLRYAVHDDHVDLRSAGADKAFDTADDVTPQTQHVLQSEGALYTVADKLMQRRKSGGRWPATLAELKTASDSGQLPGLAHEVKDGWGHDLAYAVPDGGKQPPTLTCLGADGEPGGGDDIVVHLDPDTLIVEPGASLGPVFGPAGQDAWGRPLHVRVKSGEPLLWTVSSDGADGKAGTDDDLTHGNESDVRALYKGTADDYVREARKGFEALYVHLPLVSDAALKRLWARYPKLHPTDEEALFRQWASNRKVFYDEKDPADPEKGHGAALAKRVAPDATPTLVPSKDDFPADLAHPDAKPGKDAGPKKDAQPGKDVGGGDDDAQERKAWRTQGWREIVIRETFLESVLNDLLRRCRESAQAVAKARAQHEGWARQKEAREKDIQAWDAKWAKDPSKAPKPRPEAFTAEEPKVPEEVTFQGLLAGELAEVNAGQTPPAIGYYETPEPLTREAWEANPDLGDKDQLPLALGQLKTDGAYATIPTQLFLRTTKAILRRVKYLPREQKPFEEVRDQVFDRFVVKRQMDRARAELQKLRKQAEKAIGALPEKADEAARQKAFDDAVSAWNASVDGVARSERTGLFLGSSPPTALPTDGDLDAAEKTRRERLDLVWRRGYAEVRAGAKNARTEGVPTGTLGKQVLTDPVKKDGGTGDAFLLRVARRVFPSENEFSPRRYVKFLHAKVYGSSSGARGGGPQGTFAKTLDKYLADPTWMQSTFSVLTKQSLDSFAHPRRRRR
jgi:hypothetical protein